MLKTRNPYTGELTTAGPFHYLTSQQALAALSGLAAKQSAWADLSLEERRARVSSAARYFAVHKQDIAKDITDAVGKPLSQSLGEVEAGVDKMLQLCDQATEALAPDRRLGGGGLAYEVRRVPKGVIEVIAPWNYPVFTALNGLVPALLAGNAVSLKHESCPSVGAWFERAFATENGAPLLHLLVDVPTSDWLATNAQPIAHRVFTGSVRGGRAVSRGIGERAKNPDLATPFIGCSLELGGCDVAYIHADMGASAARARLHGAVDFIINIGRMHNSGQSCCATKRLIVHPSAYEATVQRATEQMAGQVLGDPTDAKSTCGPLYGGAAACDALLDLVADAQAKGARVIVGGKDVTSLRGAALAGALTFTQRSGAFFWPTLLLDATPMMRCFAEESFGPLLPVCKLALSPGADAVVAAVDAARVGPFGLTASIWTDDRVAANAFVDAVGVGTAFINWCNDVHAAVVWSGVGLSGNGAGAMGTEGFRTLTNTKSVVAAPASLLLGKRAEHAASNSFVVQLEQAANRSANAVARLWRAGELSATKDGIGVYKVPLCLASDGQHELANAALDDIVATLQRSPGEFCPPPLAHGVVAPEKIANLLSEYRTYLNCVILAGACAAQRWDVCSEAAMAELISRQHGPTGGFMKCADDPSPTMPLSITCMAGFVLMSRGKLTEARRAAEFVTRVIAANGDARTATHFYFVGTAVPGGVVKEMQGWMTSRCLFEIDLSATRNRFYHIGISAAFLAELHACTGEPKWLKAAEAALAFAERLPLGATGCEHLCKVAWGAALVFRETRSARWHALATRVGREVFLQKQQADGLYADFVSVLSDARPLPVEGVAPGHEIASEFTYEMHYLARGLSRAAGGLDPAAVQRSKL
jgi:acyl-CoA reductase-like NAD-dependent aldehyde dehydrogenase